MNLYERTFHVEVCDVNVKNELTNYGVLRMMQEVACAHSDELGISVNHFEENPFTWMLINWKLEVISRPKWNTELLVKTWPSMNDKLYAYRDFEIYTKDNELIAKATSKWVLIDLKNHSIQKTTQEIIDTYKPCNVLVFDEPIGKIKEPTTHEFIENYKIVRTDLDTNGHTNNLSYLKIAMNALPQDVYNASFKHMEIMYKKECKLGDELSVIYSIENNKHIVTIKSKDLNTLHCIIEMW